MPQFPTWKPSALTDAVRTRHTQARESVVQAVERGRQTREGITTSVFGFATAARSRGEELPRAIIDQLRQRINWLDLATKHDVEVQSRLGRKRVSAALKEFLDEQQRHEQQLLESLRAEIRGEIASLASALSDDAFDGDAFDGDALDDEDDEPEAGDDTLMFISRRPPRGIHSELDYIDDDEIDLSDDLDASMLESPDR